VSLVFLSGVEEAKGSGNIVVEGPVPSVEGSFVWPYGHSANNMRVNGTCLLIVSVQSFLVRLAGETFLLGGASAGKEEGIAVAVLIVVGVAATLVPHFECRLIYSIWKPKKA